MDSANIKLIPNKWVKYEAKKRRAVDLHSHV